MLELRKPHLSKLSKVKKIFGEMKEHEYEDEVMKSNLIYLLIQLILLLFLLAFASSVSISLSQTATEDLIFGDNTEFLFSILRLSVCFLIQLLTMRSYCTKMLKIEKKFGRK